MMLARRIVPLLLLAAVATLSACGDSEEDKARKAVEEYMAALADGDGDRACEKLTERTREDVARRARRPCPETIEQLYKGPGRALLKRYEDASVRSVKLTGERGTATITVARATNQVGLRKEDGEWRLLSPAT